MPSARTTQGTAGSCHALLLDQELQRAVAPPARRDLIHAGIGAAGVAHRPHAQALQEPAPGDVLGQFLDRDPGLTRRTLAWDRTSLLKGMS